MKLFIKILLFVLVALVANVKVTSAAISFSNIQNITTSLQFHTEIIARAVFKISENDLANSCKNEQDLVDYRNWGEVVDAVAAKGGTKGGLNLFKFGKPTTATAEGWKTGDGMLKMYDQGSPELNWKQNSGFLRSEMRSGNPIFDSYRYPNGHQIPTGGFLNAERKLLESRGWNYNPSTGAYHLP